MSNKPPATTPPLTVDIVADIDEMDDESVLVCASGMEPTGHNFLGDGFVAGQCSQCRAAIHFSITAPTGIDKVCMSCGLAGSSGPAGMAITEQTMDEILEIMGLPDVPEIRERLKQQFLLGMQTAIDKQKELDNEGTTNVK